MDDKHLIITIGREYGSGGHEVGLKLAKHFGIQLYDKEIIDLIAKEGELSADFVHEYEETRPRFQFPMLVGGTVTPYYQQTFSDKIFMEQSKLMQREASTKSGVFIGRCSDYVLRKMNPINVFVCSDFDSRVKRKMLQVDESLDTFSVDEMEKIVKNVDKRRRQYYEYYSDKKWGASSGYDLCVNTDKIGVDGAVETIISFVEAIAKK